MIVQPRECYRLAAEQQAQGTHVFWFQTWKVKSLSCDWLDFRTIRSGGSSKPAKPLKPPDFRCAEWPGRGYERVRSSVITIIQDSLQVSCQRLAR